MIRSDKMRSFTKEESEWFFHVMKLRGDLTIPFPNAWKHFDSGLTPEETVKLYGEASQNFRG